MIKLQGSVFIFAFKVGGILSATNVNTCVNTLFRVASADVNPLVKANYVDRSVLNCTVLRLVGGMSLSVICCTFVGIELFSGWGRLKYNLHLWL